MKSDKILTSAGKLMVFIYTLFILVPIYFIILTAFKSNSELATNPIGLPAKLLFGNFIEAFVKANMAKYFINSTVVTVSAVVLSLFISVVVTFCIYRLFDKTVGLVIYSIIMGSMLIPNVGLVAMIILYQKAHIYNNLLGPILAGALGSLPFNVFILLGFIRSMPKSLGESALIDGCNDTQLLFRIIIPLIKPAMTSIGIFCFVTNWNSLLTPLLLLRDKKYFTIPLGVLNFKGFYSIDYPLLFSAVLIAGIPLIVLYLFFQRNFVEALSGSIKE